MRQKKIKWSIIVFLCIGMKGLQAQNAMFINYKSGVQTPIDVNSINKLTFNTFDMNVLKKDGSSSSYELNNIRYLNFGIATNILSLGCTKNNDLIISPNPVKDKLHIQFESESRGNVQFQIFNMQGRVIYQQAFRSLCGTNNITITLTGFVHGLYICHLVNASKIEIKKFIKN